MSQWSGFSARPRHLLLIQCLRSVRLTTVTARLAWSHRYAFSWDFLSTDLENEKTKKYVWHVRHVWLDESYRKLKFACIHIHTYMHARTKTYTHTYTHIYTYIHTYICINIWIYVLIWSDFGDMYWYLLIFADLHSYLFIFEYICWYLLVFVYNWIYLLICIDICWYAFIFGYIRI